MLYKRQQVHSRECEEQRAKQQAEDREMLSVVDDDDNNSYTEIPNFPPEGK